MRSAAWLSPHQTKEALRVASIPKREGFERAIEAEKPPTLTALALGFVETNAVQVEIETVKRGSRCLTKFLRCVGPVPDFRGPPLSTDGFHDRKEVSIAGHDEHRRRCRMVLVDELGHVKPMRMSTPFSFP